MSKLGIPTDDISLAARSYFKATAAISPIPQRESLLLVMKLSTGQYIFSGFLPLVE